MAFIKNVVFSAKWNSAFKAKTIASMITSTEFTSGKVKGDRVRVSSITGITVQDYVVGTPIVYNALGTAEIDVIMDKQKGVYVIVEDINEVQTDLNVMSEVVYDGTNKLTKQVDTDVLAQLDADATTNTDIITTGALTADNIVANLLAVTRVALNKVDAPNEGRYLVVSPENEALILTADIQLKDSGLGQNYIGSAMGIDIFWSNDLPAGKQLAGVKEASAFGASLSSMKGGTSETQVGDFLQITEVYGSKVVKRAVFSVIEA